MGNRDDLVYIYGLEACLAVFRARPDDIVRVYYKIERAKALREVLQWVAKARRPYREVDAEALEKLTASKHHEGLAFAVRPLRAGALEASPEMAQWRWVALDGVGNPHNIGAILRSCAFFGVDAVLLGGVAPGTRLPPSTLRAAEGGAEMVRVYASLALGEGLEVLRGLGLERLAIEVKGREVLGQQPLPAQGVMLLGAEQAGIAPALLAQCERHISIPHAGHLEALNVSVCAGVALAGWSWFKAEAAGAERSAGSGSKGGRRGPGRRGD